MVDKALILRKFSELELYLNQIKEYSTITLPAVGKFSVSLNEPCR